MFIPSELLKTLEKHLTEHKRPLLLAVTGTMAVGKSRFSQVLGDTLNELLGPRCASVVGLDGFFYSNSQLSQKDLLNQKGQPASFRLNACRFFVCQLQELRVSSLYVPYYDQTIKDIDPTRFQEIKPSKVYILEGVALLFYLKQKDYWWDYFILLDKDLNKIYQQYFTRFEQAFALSLLKPTPYFSDPAWRNPKERNKRIKAIWEKVHLPFYQEWVQPAKKQADWLINS